MRLTPVLGLTLVLLCGACMRTPPAPAAANASVVVSMPETTGRYRLSGERALRPAQIGDDGIHTYIVWSPEQSLPAVFAITAVGAEEMVDGHMRNGVFTIDRIHPRLVFRIDNKAARAERIVN